MLSIGLFTYSVKPRGSVVHAACLAEALREEGADVTLYALAKAGDAFYRPLACPLVLFPAGPAPEGADRLIEQRIGELHAGLSGVRSRHDLYHAEDCLTASALISATGLCPIVRTVHHVERFESRYLAECQRRSIELADRLVSVSAFSAREVREEFGRESEIVYNGVDLARFEAPARAGAGPEAPPAQLAALGLRNDDLVVMSVGGVEPRKNTLAALEAVIEACARNPCLRWLVVGGTSIWDHSELERRFDARVASLPNAVGRRITRLGALAESALTWLYRRSDLLFAPSLHEGFCLSALEALAAGTAVVCSEREPFTEFLDRETAVLVDPQSVPAMSAALTMVAGDGAIRARLTRAGLERARRFSWRSAARAHLEIYAALARSSARGVSALRAPSPGVESHA
jgi:glycosyltransferase-like protein